MGFSNNALFLICEKCRYESNALCKMSFILFKQKLLVLMKQDMKHAITL